MPRVKLLMLLVPPFHSSALHLAARTAHITGVIDVVLPHGRW
jgi:hypothetical protein